MTEGEEAVAAALRDRHPGWAISRQFWAVHWLWEARHPRSRVPLLKEDPEALSAAITEAERLNAPHRT